MTLRHRLHITLPDNLYAELKNWADPQGLSVNAAIRQSIWKMLNTSSAPTNTSSAPTNTVSPPKPTLPSTDEVVAEFLADWDKGFSEEELKAIEAARLAAEQEISAPKPVVKQSLEDIIADWKN